MKEKLERILLGVVETGNLLTNFLARKCPPPWQDKFALSNDIQPFSGCYSCWSCFDASALELHQDKDCSYTIIGVPHSEYSVGKYVFEFAWGNRLNECINVILKQGTILYYGGYLLHHRQKEVILGPFYNIGCYHNNRFFNNITKSYSRYSE